MTTYSGRTAQRIRAAVWATYGNTCHLCGGLIEHFQQMEVDHINPQSSGFKLGLHDLPNLRPAHGTRSHMKCNQRRGNKPVAQYQRTRDVNNLAWFAEGDR